jgi:hypothetical protein
MTAEEIFNMFFGGGMPGSSGQSYIFFCNNKIDFESNFSISVADPDPGSEMGKKQNPDPG